MPLKTWDLSRPYSYSAANARRRAAAIFGPTGNLASELFPSSPPTGFVEGEPADFAVLASSPVGVSVRVHAGFYVVDDDARGRYLVQLTPDGGADYETVALTAPHATNDRIDVLGIEIGDTDDLRDGQFAIVTGTAAASPTVPTYAGDFLFVPLAQIRRIKASTNPSGNQTQTNITQVREPSSVGGVVRAAGGSPANAQAGDLIVDPITGAVQSLDVDGTFHPVYNQGTTSYTPGFGSTGTAPSMKLANREGSYSIVNGLCLWEARFFFDNIPGTESIGSGTYRFGLPVAPAAHVTTLQSHVGGGFYTDTGTLRHACQAVYDAGGGVPAFNLVAGVTEIGASMAFNADEGGTVTPANGDWFTASGSYPVA